MTSPSCPNADNCPNACRHLGYCTKRYFLALQDDELERPSIVTAIRETTYEITTEKEVKPSKCREWLNDLYRDATIQAVNTAQTPIDLDMECFDPTDEQIDAGLANDWDEWLREFFRNNACRAPRNGCRVFVTVRWHKQFLTMASVIGVSYPERSQWWPRIINGKYVDPRVANDNRPPSGH